MIKEDVKDESNELRDYVDDVVLFKEGDTEEEAISGFYKDLMEAKNKLTEICQVLNDKSIFSFRIQLEREYGIKHVQITKAE
eukprot:4711704-Heterocapsa_arctica.AAC.1